MDLRPLINAEIKAINSTFLAHRVQAEARVKKTMIVNSSFISYGLAMSPSESLRKIESVQRELSNALTQKRVRMFGGTERVIARLSDYPLAIEVPHPSPERLAWNYRKLMKTQPHTMLAGRSYLNGPRDEYVSFDDSPHALIVGITGAGKSILQQIMLLSLCHSTSPEDLQIVLVDLKNEDMVPFVGLPHIKRFAGTLPDAVEAIKQVQAEKDARVKDPTRKPHRLVLWIDELAQLAQDKASRDALGDIASIGRSKAINLVAATQHPTEQGGMGAMMKANFPLRVVGMVAPGQSHIATGRAKAHADLLPGKGAFLRCQGPDVYRIQSYFIEPSDVASMAGYVAEKWGGRTGYGAVTQPVITSYEGGYESSHTSENVSPLITGYDNQFPIRYGRALTANESQIARRLAESGEFDHGGKISMNKATAYIYGSKSPDRLAWVREALSQVDTGE